jgi:hypothetical protein
MGGCLRSTDAGTTWSVDPQFAGHRMHWMALAGRDRFYLAGVETGLWLSERGSLVPVDLPGKTRAEPLTCLAQVGDRVVASARHMLWVADGVSSWRQAACPDGEIASVAGTRTAAGVLTSDGRLWVSANLASGWSEVETPFVGDTGLALALCQRPGGPVWVAVVQEAASADLVVFETPAAAPAWVPVWRQRAAPAAVRLAGQLEVPGRWMLGVEDTTTFRTEGGIRTSHTTPNGLPVTALAWLPGERGAVAAWAHRLAISENGQEWKVIASIPTGKLIVDMYVADRQSGSLQLMALASDGSLYTIRLD